MRYLPRIALASLAIVGLQATASAAAPPYLKLARILGTPELADSRGPRDRSQLLLRFVRHGETNARWTKLTTVSIVRVPEAETERATRGIVDRLHARLVATHAKIAAFDRSPVAPVTSYFAFRAKDESDAGIVYSPSPGFVTVVQVEARGVQAISPNDVAALHAVIGQ